MDGQNYMQEGMNLIRLQMLRPNCSHMTQATFSHDPNQLHMNQGSRLQEQEIITVQSFLTYLTVFVFFSFGITRQYDSFTLKNLLL